MKKNIRILVGIPCFNCESQLPRMLKKIKKDTLKIIHEIIIIDNRSTDNTVKNAITFKRYFAKYGIAFKVFVNNKNYSLGGSHKVIFDYSLKKSFTHTVILHGDDQANLDNFYPILKNIENFDHDCILGSRFTSKSKLIGYSLLRIIGNYVFNILFSIRLKRVISDMGSGLNLYSNQLLNKVNFYSSPDDLTFHCKFLIDIYNSKQKVLYTPIDWTEYDQVSNAKLLKQSVKIILLLFGLDRFFYKNKYQSKEYSYNEI